MKTVIQYTEDSKESPRPRRKSGSRGRRHYHPNTGYTVDRALRGMRCFSYKYIG